MENFSALYDSSIYFKNAINTECVNISPTTSTNINRSKADEKSTRTELLILPRCSTELSDITISPNVCFFMVVIMLVVMMAIKIIYFKILLKTDLSFFIGENSIIFGKGIQ